MSDEQRLSNIAIILKRADEGGLKDVSQHLVYKLNTLQFNSQLLCELLTILGIDEFELKKSKLGALRKQKKYLFLVFACVVQAQEAKLTEKDLASNLEFFLQRRNYVEAFLLCRLASHLGFVNIRIYLQTSAICCMNTGNTALSIHYWQEYFSKSQENNFSSLRKLNLRDNNNSQVFPKIAKDSYLKRVSEKVCVYTALFGDYDDLPPILEGSDHVEFICFTDRIRATPGWEFRVVELTESNPILENRKYKILPHEFLRDYDCSLYLDSNIFILADITKLLSTCITYPFAAWVHPERSDIYDELAAIISSFRHEPNKMLEQFLHFQKEGVKRNSGMIEACFLWRDHRDSSVSELMEEWWEFIKDRGNRDQPGLTSLMEQLGVRPSVFREEFGTTRLNDFFVKLPHKGNPLNTKFCDEKNGESPSVLASKKVYFVYRENQKQVASTYMRGYQLSEIIAKEVDSLSVNYVNEEYLSSIKNALVVITKGFLKKATKDEISLLKENGNIIAFDFVDDPPREQLVAICDVLIASSIQQLLYYKKYFPSKLSHMITHHTDPEIPNLPYKTDKSSIGYFGELVNAKWRDDIPDKVGFVLTNTKTRTKEWISELANYNCHYAVRNRREIDGFKPFLKGFTAAHCNSAIIIPKSEGDARFYLTSDYPYLCETDELDDVLATIEHYHASFGSSEHRFAMDIMRSVKYRSTPQYISREFKKLLSSL
ncbi:DUF616 domain-containing protein [Alteromonas sp. BL110]|uniref:DUF616 domain-containing protein n=1 Tax=Alteromonas sp. BL110 TaxID=1714845 RepID=UPI000E4EDB68|nr:DUF616 domain-containing protein [Alteromonas sp. BL110]AXT39012.1 DUF616 domain-containing protein [Alteromonas sp. BL110]RKM84345.1 DUF616 domain-containing protein [Alteromonas sp. BL110]